MVDLGKQLEIFRKEWEELVPAAKYIIIFSLILILLIWIDKLLELNFYDSVSNKFTLNFKNIYFLIANLFIFIIFIVLIFERLIVNLRVIYFKLKYPLKNLNTDFFIIAFKQKVFLIDKKRKEIRWIKTWQTVLDLDFIGEWTKIDVDVEEPNGFVDLNFTTNNGIKIDLKNFKYVDGIHTQKPLGT